MSYDGYVEKAIMMYNVYQAQKALFHEPKFSKVLSIQLESLIKHAVHMVVARM